jgi:hypothetical protein
MTRVIDVTKRIAATSNKSGSTSWIKIEVDDSIVTVINAKLMGDKSSDIEKIELVLSSEPTKKDNDVQK